MSDQEPRGYWERRLTARYRLEGVGFHGLGEPYNRWLYRVRKVVFRRVVRSLPIDPRRCDVLDIGSGTGFYIERWRAAGARSITGADITDVAVAKLTERFPETTFHRLDVGDDEDCVAEVIGRERFDVVSAFDVLFHIVDDARYERAVRNIGRALRPGGWFLFSDNFIHGEAQRALFQVSRPLADIERTVVSSGFRIVKRMPMFVLMNASVDTGPAWVERIWNRIRARVEGRKETGGRVGAALYPFELVLTRFAKESRTTEIMICQKIA